MGFTRITLEIANVAQPERRRTVQLLVDTGALMTVVPATVLEELGIQPVTQRRFRGFGGVSTRRVGIAQFTYQEDVAGAPVVFGEPEDTPVMGVTTLEALGYEVDPANERIVRVESLLL
ncbi:MAG: aspartyl protease family protein [Chloroflexi bacterium]|nr:aspartyl protease family protein [Chloroflexota bacterium]